jgi:hypothetical protein
VGLIVTAEDNGGKWGNFTVVLHYFQTDALWMDRRVIEDVYVKLCVEML